MINATAYEPGISASIGIESVKALAELTARAGHIPNPKLDADLKALNAMGAMSGIYSQKRISSGVEDLNKHFANADKHDGVYRAPMLANYMGKVADFTRGINNTAVNLLANQSEAAQFGAPPAGKQASSVLPSIALPQEAIAPPIKQPVKRKPVRKAPVIVKQAKPKDEVDLLPLPDDPAEKKRKSGSTAAPFKFDPDF